MSLATWLLAHLPQSRLPVWRAFAMLGTAALQFALAGCASWQIPTEVDDVALRARAVSATEQEVQLSATVLSAEDSRRMFGVDVNGTGIQPVWLQVENKSPQMLWLLRAGTDPDYFSSLEVAWSLHAPLANADNAALDEHLDRLGFQNPIPPGATRAGIIFTNPHRRTRLLNVDLVGQRRMIPFTLFLPVPDEAPDVGLIPIRQRYAATEAPEYADPDALRAALERLPGYATGADETASADPANVVMIGELADIGAALVRRGFRRDTMELDNAQRLFGRPPDIVVRKAGQGGVPANWLRLWLVPLRYQGQAIFLVQAGRPVGGRFAVAEGKDLILHPDVDEARNLLIQDLLYSGGLAKLGFVGGVGAATVARPRDSLAGTKYYTDGLRAVMFFATRPLALSDVQILDWIPLPNREGDLDAEKRNAQQ
ncbi:hypothetical protein AT959_16310 [Dechloromonas denitrificans]|uniref:LssY-like C-terminal domain-containing protein n=1 Tax=Dechloromonas denitrificans TaxID=281362 RepID=A0A133XEY7_9RHOO|nr:LssY C-terminal domain-containing protein [Dechloromonas denitrificans]KXB29508.1 hypothetical protein AT959_16310 [Dechloromonas denitrificans]